MRPEHAPLSNGAILLQRSPATPRRDRVVMAEMPGTPQPFVTWVEDETGGLFAGHYFETMPEAADDFRARSARAA